MVEVISPTNIAIVKYWGKKKGMEKYNVPTKSSLSITVDNLYSETKLEIEKGRGDIDFSLNGKKIEKDKKEFSYVERFFQNLYEIDDRFKHYNYHIESKNNFPTAAGFASSASGFSALAKALGEELKESELFKYFEDDKKISMIARMGSGSASRSVPENGGFVIWHRGDSHENSYAESLFDYSHWRELNIIYVILSGKEKKVKSRKGMQISVETNPLYFDWVEYEEKVVLPSLIKAIEEKDFEKFGEIAIRCSDALHSVMRYSYPPIIYTNDKSHEIMEKIFEFNEEGIRAAYTFDAGPNPILFVEDENREELLKFLGVESYVITKPGKGSRIKEG